VYAPLLNQIDALSLDVIWGLPDSGVVLKPLPFYLKNNLTKKEMPNVS